MLAKPVNDFAVVMQLSPEARAAAEHAAAEVVRVRVARSIPVCRLTTVKNAASAID